MEGDRRTSRQTTNFHHATEDRQLITRNSLVHVIRDSVLNMSDCRVDSRVLVAEKFGSHESEHGNHANHRNQHNDISAAANTQRTIIVDEVLPHLRTCKEWSEFARDER